MVTSRRTGQHACLPAFSRTTRPSLSSFGPALTQRRGGATFSCSFPIAAIHCGVEAFAGQDEFHDDATVRPEKPQSVSPGGVDARGASSMARAPSSQPPVGGLVGQGYPEELAGLRSIGLDAPVRPAL